MTFKFPEGTQGEAQRARSRRLKEGFFEDFCQGRGIDIGAGKDPLFFGIDTWDWMSGQGDATFMRGIADNTYDFAHCSHILEHLQNPWEAIRNWHRIVKPGGYVIIDVPHRDLYEKKLELPSRWNPEHKKFWLLSRHENEWTLGLIQTVQEALEKSQFTLLLARTLMRGLTKHDDPNSHSWGEYSNEVVFKKGPII